VSLSLLPTPQSHCECPTLSLPSFSPKLIVSRLVLSTLQPLLKSTPTRQCYRLIGGTLVQRTVTDVYPALETNYTGIKEVLDTLVRTYRGKEEEFGGFQREYEIQVGLAKRTGNWLTSSKRCRGRHSDLRGEKKSG